MCALSEIPSVTMESTGTMSSLFIPNELLTLIFANLNKADLKLIRLVCQGWCSLATPRLFHTIYFSPWPKDLEVFSQWTLNERCRQAVKELVYDTSIMDSISEEIYADRLWEHLEQVLRRSGNTKFLNLGPEAMDVLECIEKECIEKEWPPFTHPIETSEFLKCQVVGQGYQAYDEQNRQHTDMRHSGEILLRLTQGLRQLTSLESIRIIDDLDWAGDDDDEDFKPTLLGPMRQHGSPFARSWHPLYLHPEPPFYDEDDFDTYQHERAHEYNVIVRALSISNRRIKKFWVCSSSEYRMSLLSFDTTEKLAPRMPMLRHTFQVFPTIASLHLDIGIPNPTNYSFKIAHCMAGLHACLFAMRHLQDLHLHLYRRHIYCLFHQIFGRPCHVWPLLSKFKLRGVKAEAQDLVEFFTKHSIRTLRLSNIRLSGHEWITVMDALRTVEPKIQEVVLSECLQPSLAGVRTLKDPQTSSTIEEAVAQYIVSGGPAPKTIDWA